MNKTCSVVCSVTAVIGVTELVYYIFMKYKVKAHLSPYKKGQVPLFEHPATIVRDIYTKCANLSNYSFDKWIQGVFLGTSTDNIGTDNFKSFLAWYLYVTSFDELTEDEQDIVERLCDEAVETFDLPKVCGFIPDTPHCSLGLNELTYTHLPLLFSTIFAGINGIFSICQLRRTGFISWIEPIHHIYYWYYKHPNPTHPPILFFHGMGPGWISYSAIITELSKTRSILLVNYDCIVLYSIKQRAVDCRMLSDSVSSALDHFNLSRVSIIGHSWGTFLAGWILKTIPERVMHCTLIDPVALFVPYPEIIHYVVYKPSSTWKEYIFHWFVRQNVNIAYILSRHFAWYNVVILMHEIPESIGVVISISGADELLNVPAATELTQLYIQGATARKTPIKAVYWPGLLHGDSVKQSHSISGILETIQTNEFFSLP